MPVRQTMPRTVLTLPRIKGWPFSSNSLAVTAGVLQTSSMDSPAISPWVAMHPGGGSRTSARLARDTPPLARRNPPDRKEPPTPATAGPKAAGLLRILLDVAAQRFHILPETARSRAARGQERRHSPQQECADQHAFPDFLDHDVTSGRQRAHRWRARARFVRSCTSDCKPKGNPCDGEEVDA